MTASLNLELKYSAVIIIASRQILCPFLSIQLYENNEHVIMMFTRSTALFLAMAANGATAFVSPSQARLSMQLAAQTSDSALVSDIKVAVC